MLGNFASENHNPNGVARTRLAGCADQSGYRALNLRG